MTNATRYMLAGIVAGLLAPMALLVWGEISNRLFDPTEVFALLAVSGMLALGVAGRMIGHRDDVFEALSAIDPLTGIPNRRTFDEKVAAELARSARYGTPLSLVMIDLDKFKDLNDRHGHRVGDSVLRGVAGILQSHRRAGDLVARYGGEEFVAILPHTGGPDAMVWAERARQAVAAAEIMSEAGPLRITASFGVAADGHDRDAEKNLVNAADDALYEAKRRGRNQTVMAEGNSARRQNAAVS